MAASTPIGNVSQFVIKTSDTMGEAEDIAINKNFIANPEATYEKVDTAMRALMQLSNNQYQDTICITNISVVEQIAE